MAWLLCLLLATAGAAKAAADASAHGSPRLLRWFPRWAGPVSWRNKYRRGDPDQGPRFPGSTSVFVFASDLWHFFTFLTWACADAAFLLAAWPVYRWWAVGAALLRRCVFVPVYQWLRS